MCRRLVFTYEAAPIPEDFHFYIAEGDKGFARQMPDYPDGPPVQIIKVAVQPYEGDDPGFMHPHFEVLGKLVSFVSEAHYFESGPTEYIFKGELKQWGERLLALAAFP